MRGLIVTVLSVDDEETPSRYAHGPAPAAVRFIEPTPLPTEKLAAVPLSTQLPPVSAGPQPVARVRSKASVARVTGPTGAATVTSCETESVPPRLSVTFRTTV